MPKNETITPKHTPSDSELKEGTNLIRRAYFKSWYESCSEIYNRERRKKRKEKKKEGKKYDDGNTISRF